MGLRDGVERSESVLLLEKSNALRERIVARMRPEVVQEDRVASVPKVLRQAEQVGLVAVVRIVQDDEPRARLPSPGLRNVPT